MIAVTGATGAVGSRVAARLAALGMSQRLIVRDPSRAPDIPGADVAIASGYGDVAAMTTALRGARTMFMVSGRESAERVAEHRLAIDAAHAAGVTRIVYLSFLNAAANATFTLSRDHYATERYIRERGSAFTFVQDSLYLDLLPMMVSADGVIAAPAGDGVVACVSRDDVADAVVAVLAGDDHDGRTYRLTGPQALSLAEVAATITTLTKRSVTYKNETLAEAYASRAAYGAPTFEVEGWISSYLAIGNGELSTVTDDVATLTGRRAETLAAFLERTRPHYDGSSQ